MLDASTLHSLLNPQLRMGSDELQKVEAICRGQWRVPLDGIEANRSPKIGKVNRRSQESRLAR